MTETKGLLAAICAVTLAAGLACKSNHPPNVPAVPIGPTYCARDTTYTFKTIVTDPDGNPVAVRFDWGDSVVSGWTALSPSGDTVALTHAWRDTGIYEVSAQAEDEGQQRSGWSGRLAVQVVLRNPPNMPHEVIGPDRGGQDTSYTFTTSASHPDNITVAIRFAWGDGDTSDWSAFVASGETVAMEHKWTTPDTYAVTAQARDTGSGRSMWTLPHNIVIKPPDTLRIWRLRLADSAGTMSSSPAIGPDGTIYVGSSDSSLYAVSPEGTVEWWYVTGGRVQSAPAIAPDGTVYFGSSDNYLYALCPDGTLKWRCATAGDVNSSPAIASDGTVYVGSDDDFAYAVNPDGSPKWRYNAGADVEASPAVAADGTVYFGAEHCFYALNPDSTLKWVYTTRGRFQSAPAIAADGTVYAGAYRDPMPGFYALNPDGTVRWSYPAGYVRAAPAIAADGAVYFGSSSNHLHAANPDGTLKWQYETGGDVNSGPAVAADGTVYVGSNDDCLYALYPDGTLKWRYETEGNIRSSPTIGADGTVYFTSDDGYLYALKGTSPLASSAWPKFHHDLRNTGRVGGGK